MPRQNLIACALVAAIASALPFAAALDEALAAQAAAQTSRQEGVTVTVAPPGFARGAKTWDFAITLETHTQPLDDDLVNGTTLLTDGNPYRPLGWKGSPPRRAPPQGRPEFRGGDAAAAGGGIADTSSRGGKPPSLPLEDRPIGPSTYRSTPWQSIPYAA
jgi:hypothetical protein